MIEFTTADSDAEREAVFQFWYSVYVEELGRFQESADHANRLLCGPEDDRSRLYCALDDGVVIAAFRHSWGGDGFSDRQISQYSLQPFLRDLPAGLLSIGERNMIAPAYRGSTVYGDLVTAGDLELFVAEHDVRVSFGASEAHLVGYYAKLGMRPYAARNVNSEESGYLIPSIAIPAGVDSMRGVSRDRPDGDPELPLPPCIQDVAAGTGAAVHCASVSGAERYAHILDDALARLPMADSVFRDLGTEQVSHLTDRSILINCVAGDVVVRRGATARTVFVLLEGEIDVGPGGSDLGRFAQPGDLFAESVYLRGGLQTDNAIVTSKTATVLGLLDGTLRKARSRDPELDNGLSANIERQLRRR